MVAPRTGCGCSCCSDEQQENFQKHNLCCSPTLKCGPYCELVPSIWQLFLAVFSNDFFKILSNMSRYQSLGIQQGIWGTLLLTIGKRPFLFVDLSLYAISLAPRQCINHCLARNQKNSLSHLSSFSLWWELELIKCCTKCLCTHIPLAAE